MAYICDLMLRMLQWFKREIWEVLWIVLYVSTCLLVYHFSKSERILTGATGLAIIPPVAVTLVSIRCFVRWTYLSYLRFMQPDKKQIYFTDQSYFKNNRSRWSTTIRSLWVLKWIFLLFGGLIYAHYYFEKKDFYAIKGDVCVRYTSLERIDATSLKMNCQFNESGNYTEKDYVQNNGEVLVNILLILTGLVISNYWNNDAIFGRIWGYCCEEYSKFIDIPTSDKGSDSKSDLIRKETRRVNLCLDILDHGFWNTEQFQNFFRYELAKCYYFLNTDDHLIKRLKEDSKISFLAEKVEMIKNFMVRYNHYLANENKILTIELRFVRAAFSYLSMLVEEENYRFYPNFSSFSFSLLEEKKDLNKFYNT